jgi:hypothetical protein
MMMGMSCASLVLAIHAIANGVVKVRQTAQKNNHVQPAALSEDRMQRLEAAVEAIAIEVERISEGQRFTTKLLSENSHQPVAVQPRIGPLRYDTPH